MTFFDVLDVLGYVLRFLGAAVFGLGVGWLTVRAVKQEGAAWQLLVAVYLGLLASFVLLGAWVAGGATLGAYGLGAGAGILIWGLIQPKPKKGDDEEATPSELRKRK
jgi:hypothetical protein